MAGLKSSTCTVLPRRRPPVWLVIVLISLFGTFNARAHSPHDVIKSVAVSPGYASDQTLFIYVLDELKRSTDGGASWQNLENGLDNNKLITDIKIATVGPGRYQVFATTRGEGVYTSVDRGDSWHSLRSGLNNAALRSLVISPAFSRDQTLLARTDDGDLFLSTDAGKHWREVAAGRFAASAATLLVRDGSLRALVGDSQGRTWLSDGDFQQWAETGHIDGSGAITVLSAPIHNQGTVTLYAGTESGGLFQSTDWGSSYRRLPLSSASPKDTGLHITSLAALQLPTGAVELFVTTWNEAAFHSPDGGSSWRHVRKGISKTSQADQHKAPHFYEVAVPSPQSPDTDNRCCAFVAGFAGLFRFDGADSWTEMETRPAGNIEGLAVAASRSGQHLLALASYDAGAYISGDSGSSWDVRNVGLRSTHLWDIAVSEIPQQPTVFAVSNMSFLSSGASASAWHRNEIAASASWKLLSENFDEGSLVMRLARRVMERPGFTFPTQIAVSPTFAEDNTVFLGTRRQGIFKSTDGGSNWDVVWKADKGWVASLKLSPDFSHDGVMAASLRGQGLYLSSDGGKRWTQSTSGLSPAALGFRGLGTGAIQFSPGFKTDNTLYFGTADGLYVSVDRARSWQKVGVSGTPAREHIKTVTLSPDYVNDGTVLVSVKGRGLFKSTDHGESFREVAPELIRDNKLLKLIRYAPDYAASRTLFAASAEHAYRSRDAGQSWERLQRPVRYENTKDNIFYTGPWKLELKNNFSALSIHKTRGEGARADVYFTGEGFTWYGPRSEDFGEAKVYIDGQLSGTVSQFAAQPSDSAPVYSVTGLARKAHLLSIVKTANRSPRSGPYIAIDAIEVY